MAGANTVTLGPPTAAQCFGTEGIVLDRKNTNLYIFGNNRTPVLIANSTAAGATTTTSATGGAATALPAAPLGYLTQVVNGVTVKIPYYSV